MERFKVERKGGLYALLLGDRTVTPYEPWIAFVRHASSLSGFLSQSVARIVEFEMNELASEDEGDADPEEG